MTTTKISDMHIHRDFLVNCHMNPVYSDVVLVVENEEFYASRIILSMQSTYFEALFNGNFEEGRKEKVALEEVKAKHFKLILQYMYTGRIEIETLNADYLIELLSSAHFLGVHVVVQIIANHMATPHTNDNMVSFFNIACLFDLKDLQDCSMSIIEYDARKIITSDVFYTFNEEAVLTFLGSDNLPIEEYAIFEALEKWLQINPHTRKAELLDKIRLSLIKTQVLIKHVAPKKLFTEKQILDAILLKSDNQIEKYRYLEGLDIYVRVDKHNLQPYVNEYIYKVDFLSAVRFQTIGRVEVENINKHYGNVYMGFTADSQPLLGKLEQNEGYNAYVFLFEPREADHFFIRVPRVDENIQSYKNVIVY